MAEALIFYYRHQHTALSRANPLTKFISVIAICIMLFTLSLPGLGVVTVVLGLAMWRQRLPIIRYRRELRYFTIILLLIIITEYIATAGALAPCVAALRFLIIIITITQLYSIYNNNNNNNNIIIIRTDQRLQADGGYRAVASVATQSAS